MSEAKDDDREASLSSSQEVAEEDLKGGGREE